MFIDIVGYSKLLLDEQKERLRELTEIVLATPQVIKTTNEQLVRLPTGDGMALDFRNSSEEPVQCALEIAQALKQHPEVLVRMGIHSGPVSEVTDVNGRTNIEYFSDGMSEEFISSLSRLPVLKVVGRTSSSQLKGTTDARKTTAQKLGAYYPIAWRVRKSHHRSEHRQR